MTFICNAGPIIAMAKIDRLLLLKELADSVLIPITVFHEMLAKPGAVADRIIKASESFLNFTDQPKSIAPVVELAIRQPDAGEKQVIALDSSTPAPLTVVPDDAAG